MFQFKFYTQAESLEEAYELNQKKNHVILGGMMWLKMGQRTFHTAVDLKKLGLSEIEETQKQFKIGAMCTLRQLEQHPGLDASFGGLVRECVRHIVGAPFRNTATLGGSIFGRFGFSDILTALLCLDTSVQLYQGGRISLEKYAQMPPDRDIITHIIIKKDGRKCMYQSQRLSATDFPIIACGVSKLGEEWYLSVGARPMRAKRIKLSGEGGILPPMEEKEIPETAKRAAEQFRYGTNMRGSGEYRQHLAEVYLKRSMLHLWNQD